MSQMLSDQDLIRIVQEKTPDDLTEAEIDQLRIRLHASPELRNVLLEQLHLETYLGAALGRFEVSVEEIVNQAAVRPVNRIAYWGWGLVLILGIYVGCVLVMTVWFPPAVPNAAQEPEKKLVADAGPAKPDARPDNPPDADPQPSQPARTVAAAAKPATDPVPAAVPVEPAPPAVAWQTVIEAERFDRGNLKIDTTDFGLGFGVVQTGGERPAFAEYDVTVPKAGHYRIELRYASAEPRPLVLSLNGKVIQEGVAGKATGSWHADGQQAVAAGTYPFENGKNVLRLEAAESIPNLDKLAIAAAASSATSSPDAAPILAAVGREFWRKVVEAESFVRGNARIDLKGLGRDIGIVYGDSREPVFVEYEIEIPQEGRYQLDLRYASKSAQPLALNINGRRVKEQVAAYSTRDNRPKAQTWFREGVFEFRQGRNVVRLESNPPPKQKKRGQFPALDKLALAIPQAETPDSGDPAAAPWTALMQPEAAPLDAVAASFDLQSLQGGMRQQDLQQWLEPVPGAPITFHEGRRTDIPVAAFEGLVRLKAPWVPDAVLRLAMFEHAGVKLHFWNGREGVTLQYYQQPRPAWAAYRTERSEEQNQPSRLALIATDDGRYERTWLGPIELRHQEGTLVLSRGDLRLLTVPLAEPPGEVFFEHRAWFRGIAMYRGQPLPDEAPNARPYVLRSARPAAMAWKRQLPPGATVEQPAGGLLSLTADKTKEYASVSLPIDEPGLHEVILQVENAQPGTGVFLSDDAGKPLHQVGFFREERTGWTSFGFLRPGELHVKSNFDPNYQPAPFVDTRMWLRLVLGPGSLKCWISGDGVHWGRAFEPLRQVPGGFARVGLYCLPGEGRRSIGLRHLEVRELSALTEIVATELRERALSLPGDMDAEDWLRMVLESQPEDVDPSAWRQACAVRTLTEGASLALGRVLLSSLAADVLTGDSPPEQKLRFLDEAALLADTWDQGDGLAFLKQYEELGRQLQREGHPRPFSLVAGALLRTPVWTIAPVQTSPESLLRYELLQLVSEARWDEAWTVARRQRFWNWSGHPDLQWPGGREGVRRSIEWCEATVARHLPQRRGNDLMSNTAAWRHPLIEELSKEGYNILAEFEAALSGEAYKDACQIITGAGTAGALGLLTDAQDARLLVSLPRAVWLAMREHPPLQQTMIDTFGPIGRLRVRQAQSTGDVAGALAATVQFTGTDAAAEAHAWLGDRALAGGNFTQALGHYRQALRHPLPTLRGNVLARQRLAAAMLGQTLGEPVTDAVLIGEETVSPAAFEQLIAELKAAPGAARVSSASPAAAQAQGAPPPAGYKVGRRIAFEGDIGQNAGSQGFSGVDTAGRELSADIVAGMLLVSNRFQINAYDLVTGQRKWGQGLGGEQGDARFSPLSPMRPVQSGDCLYVRRLTKSNPDIACLDLATGAVRWTRRPGHFAACDPLVVQDELFVISAETPQPGILQLSLCNLDPRNGEVLSEHPLIQLRDAAQAPCSALAVDDAIIAVVGGSVLCCDLFGQPRWLRRQPWFPPSQEPAYYAQHHQPPVVSGRRVFVAQPGVLSVDCLDIDSGRMLWQRVLPNLRRIVGLIDDRLVIETEEGLQALEAKTGKSDWFYDETELLEAQVLGSPGGILLTRRETLRAGVVRPALVWLDPATGEPQARAPLDELTEKTPFLGPLVVQQDRLWVGFGKTDRDPKREWVELIPSGNAAPGDVRNEPLLRWTEHVDPRLQAETAEALPGWTLLTAQADMKAGVQPERKGERDALATLATRERAVTLARRLALRPEGSTRLILKTGGDAGAPWDLTVRVNSQTLLAAPIEAKPELDWQQFEVDLTPFKGQNVWLTVSQSQSNHPQSFAFWKRLEVAN